MIQALIKAIDEVYPLQELSTEGFSGLRAQGMKFLIHRYEAEGLGSVSTMEASGFFGLMKMDTLIITPTQIDMPLLSYDRVHAMGNDTLIFEAYDTLLGDTDLVSTQQAQSSGASLPEHDVGSHWYDSIKLPVSLSKKGKKQSTAGFDALTKAYVAGFLADCQNAAPCDAVAKREKASVYVEGLLSHGGPSTDVFKKALGEEKTALLFRKVLFGTEI